MSGDRHKEVLLGLLAGLLFYGAFSKWNLYYLLFPAYALGLTGSLLRLLTFGFTGFFLSLRWVAIPPSEFGGVSPLLAYLSLFLLVSFLTAYQFLLPYFLWRKLGKKWSLFPFLYVLAEVLRSHFPYGGFPWLVAGVPLVELSLLSPLFKLYTVYGVSLFVLWASLFKELKLKTFFALPFLLFALFLPQESPRYGLKVALVQPAVPEEVKLNVRAFVRTYPRLLELVEEALKEKPDLVLLPETAVPFFLEEFERYGKELLRLSEKAPILLGIIDFSGERPKNAVVLLEGGKVKEVYHKTILVPFGEYTPFPFRYLSFLVPYFGLTDYEQGEGPKCFKVKHLTLGTPVCFEVAYYHYVRAFKCELLAVLTNDAWFKDSDGTYQHFAWARVRAAELGKFLLWVNNSGPSAVIDHEGRVRALLPYGKEGVLHFAL